jgi:hypothetical protein
MQARKFGTEVIQEAGKIEAQTREFAAIEEKSKNRHTSSTQGTQQNGEPAESEKPIGTWNIPSANEVSKKPGAIGKWIIPEVKSR